MKLQELVAKLRDMKWFLECNKKETVSIDRDCFVAMLGTMEEALTAIAEKQWVSKNDVIEAFSEYLSEHSHNYLFKEEKQ